MIYVRDAGLPVATGSIHVVRNSSEVSLGKPAFCGALPTRYWAKLVTSRPDGPRRAPFCGECAAVQTAERDAYLAQLEAHGTPVALVHRKGTTRTRVYTGPLPPRVMPTPGTVHW